MSDKSRIEWTESTWNPTTGCTKVSQGCKHCYAERDWPRMVRLPAYQGREFTDVACHPERLDQPLRWRKPRRIFVNSMSDLFHQGVPEEFIAQVFAVMAATPEHTYQVLTKRPERMLALLDGPGFSDLVDDLMHIHTHSDADWPLPNVWLGVSVEDQATADERIPLLLQTPAAVRWISAEPLLGPIDMEMMRVAHDLGEGQPYLSPLLGYVSDGHGDTCRVEGLDWVVAGGESGPKARPSHPGWFRSLRYQCKAADVPFLFKQWGEWIGADQDECPVGGPASRWVWADGKPWHPQDGQRAMPLFCRAGKKAAGRHLDGDLHDDYPA